MSVGIHHQMDKNMKDAMERGAGVGREEVIIGLRV